MSALAPAFDALRAELDLGPGSGFRSTAIPGVRVFWATEPAPRTPLLYDSGIVIVGRGRKRAFLGDEILNYDPDNYLVLSLPLALECETLASPEEPLLGIFVDIDRAALHELVALMAQHGALPALSDATPPRGVDPAPLDPGMAAAVERLVRGLCDPLEAAALGGALTRDVLYRALHGPHRDALVALTLHGGQFARVARAMRIIHRDYARPLSVGRLSREAGMSSRAFHRAFHAMTRDTPLQYLKKVRLSKAHGLLVHDRLRASAAAAAVGYESASQFSREFKRYFAVAPSEAADAGSGPPAG